MTAPLVPATLAFAPDGTPYSAAYRDVYGESKDGKMIYRETDCP